MSAPRTWVVAFSDVRRFQTTVSGGRAADAIEVAEQLWDEDGVDGEHPFELIDDCTFDQPEARIEDAPPPEREWTVTFHCAGVHKVVVPAHTERQAIATAQAMLFETDAALFNRAWSECSDWTATPSEGGASCR
jgi:hypothetical protein